MVREAFRTRLVSAWSVTSFSVTTVFAASSAIEPSGATWMAPKAWLPWVRASADTWIARRRSLSHSWSGMGSLLVGVMRDRDGCLVLVDERFREVGGAAVEPHIPG